MLITKYTHACVRLELNGRVLVIDPGVWSEPRALAGAHGVLVTHEHADHVDVLRLAGLGVPVYAPNDAEIDVKTTSVAAGDEFIAGGFTVRAVGGKHAVVYDGQPDCANLGYIINDCLYHPGDALHVPDQPIETLLVPVQGSWLKTNEAIDFVAKIQPKQSFGIHDAQVNERGLSSLNEWLAHETAGGYRYLAPGETAQ